MKDAPDRIWASYDEMYPEIDGGVWVSIECKGLKYIRADIVEELIHTLDRIAEASDIYGLEAHAETQGAEVLAFAHRTICIIARDALAKARGEQE